MPDALLQAAQAEETALVAELRRSPTFRKWEAVRALLSAYQEAERQVAAETASAPPVVQRPSQREGSLSTAISKFVGEHFRRTGRRAPAPDLLGPVLAAGIKIGGEKPVNALASVLSANPEFNNVRGKGYGLAVWGEGDGPAGSLFPGPSESPASIDPPSDRGNPVEASETDAATRDMAAGGYSIADDDGRIAEEAA